MAEGVAPDVAGAAAPLPSARDVAVWRIALRNRGVLWGGVVLALIALVAVIGPWFVVDPTNLNPMTRLRPPGEAGLMGTDQLGRDVFSRVLSGARVSLVVGLAVAVIAIAIGLVLGLVAGYVRWTDAIIMRVMDGLMSIPAILLAIAMISLSGATLGTVVAAIVIPEIPRVTRLVRSVVLTVREEAYVEAAIAAGTRVHMIMVRHVLPNTIAPLIVQATYICGSAMLTEAILGFLGAGIPPEIPSWGNIMSEGRTFFQLTPWIIFFPGLALAVTVLAVNIVGDGLRDTLDPRIARTMR
ncbi:ABC transporter permease [Jannaschia aquimarina]|uniref:GsiD_3 protein n=1 Tax=Jannaschia aquimarina TaxID=935700 RepID=A0A0D1EDL9_9RHOB|nr:ABC transporter permease [Jannaschia aquimarina]KIT15041.1 Glutathione transport system permease protein GsiD [Jannaschia aquimarina]SNS62587.1 peptide/nickel transport system permease protein [Jannaschia aquimarina]